MFQVGVRTLRFTIRCIFRTIDLGGEQPRQLQTARLDVFQVAEFPGIGITVGDRAGRNDEFLCVVSSDLCVC